MLTFTSGNMFDTPADIRINTVNCVGVMGAGLALAFKTKYPDMFRDYQKACKAGEVKPGKLHVSKKLFGDWIINFPTKRHWREPSRYEDIEAGLIALRKYLVEQGKVKVLLPAVGCGHGGLEWSRISEMIKKQLADLEAEIVVFTPSDSRAAGDKIKDHDDKQAQGRLDAEGIKTVEPGDDLFPISLRGRTAAKLYIKGDPKKFNSPLLTILPSMKPTQHEIAATATAIESIMRPGLTLLVGYGATIERPAMKRALEKGADVVLILAEGILGFRVRKDLLDVWDENRILVISATKPLERWSPSTAFRAKDLQLSLASVAIITDPEPQPISKMLLQKASQKLPLIYYIDYGKKFENIINTFKKIKAQDLAVNDLSNPSYFEAIINILGSHETTQPISEKYAEAITAPIADHHVTNEAETRSIKGPEVHAKQGTAYPKRLIEVDLPIKRISTHARREKSIRHGHISTLHIWWARRPLASCRAVICAALWPDPADPLCPDAFRETARKLMLEWAEKHAKLLTSQESLNRFIQIQKNPDKLNDGVFLRQALLDFIADFANWDNSTVKEYLDTSRALTQAAHEALGGEPGTRPLVVDPFAGGGSIPLEALRVGADAFASDLNPVAVLLNKVVLEYIPKYGQQLADEVRKWGEWIKQEAGKELAKYYPKDPDGETPIAYLWARTIQCEGPGCGAEVPLLRSQWLLKNGRNSVAIDIVPDKKTRCIEIEVLENPRSIDIGDGTVKRGVPTCPVCGYSTPLDAVKRQFRERHGGTTDARLFAIILETNGKRKFRKPDGRDLDVIVACTRHLSEQKQNHHGPLSFIPDEDTTHYHSFVNRASVYGLQTWEDFYNIRQRLALGSFADLVRRVPINTKEEIRPAVITLLAFAVDRCADYWSSLATWGGQFIAHTFGRQALPFVWDYAEANPFSESTGNWSGAVEWIARVIERESTAHNDAGQVLQADATAHPLPNDSVDAVVTDPPYYYAIQYADLSDYFYVWLKRTLAGIHPDLLTDAETPKAQEAIVQSPGDEYSDDPKNRKHYEYVMTKALARSRELTRASGIGVVVFANATTDGWEALLESLISTGWVVTGSWPIDTERPGRVISSGRSVLASSVHLVCRPREKRDSLIIANNVGEWRDVLAELPTRIHDWLPRLAKEGIVGADAIFACLGPALELFSRYSRVEKASGEPVALREYLEQVWASVSKEALNMIFAGADATGFEEDARLTAMWLWTLSTGNNGSNGKTAVIDEDIKRKDEDNLKKKAPLTGHVLEYDAARKIAQGLGIHLDKLKSLVEVKGETARLLPVAERATYLFGKEAGQEPAKRKKKDAQLSLFEFMDQEEQEGGNWQIEAIVKIGHTVLDQLHQGMILFAAGRGEALKRFLVEEGIGRDQRFWRLAQAFSALYPSKSDEKRWVDGVLARNKGFGF